MCVCESFGILSQRKLITRQAMIKFRQDLYKVKPYTPGKPIEEVKRALRLDHVYKLASNEIPFLPAHVKKNIMAEFKNINRYPESGCFYLRKMVARKLKVGEERIVFGNGSDELITLVIRALIDKDDEVVIAEPTFLIYEIQAAIQSAKIIKVPLKDLRYNLQAIAESVTGKTKVVFIANPDNPTGSYVTHKEVEQFLDRIPQDVLIFFDEAYYEFAPRNFPRTSQFVQERSNIIFTRTFSKAFGLAGLRIGYGITTPEIAELLNKIREPFNINRLAQAAALAALENKKFLEKVVAYNFTEKEYLYRELASLDVSFIKSATNFILIDFKRDTGAFCNYLLKKGVIIREMKGWGLTNFFRVTVGRHNENALFIKHLKSYLKE